MTGWLREYKYRKAVGGSHADYLDTDLETIEAMIRIQDAYTAAENRQQAKSAPEPTIS
ncbi:hypothetical protein ACFFGR_09160 [Arthrobacter liuii]|nr:hypothetical protein [Arthrobacter liuii]